MLDHFLLPFIISFASAGLYDIISENPHLSQLKIRKKIEAAYKRALKKCRKNADKYEYKSCFLSSSFTLVEKDIKRIPQNLTEGDKELLRLFRKELEADNETQAMLHSIVSSETLLQIKENIVPAQKLILQATTDIKQTLIDYINSAQSTTSLPAYNHFVKLSPQENYISRHITTHKQDSGSSAKAEKLIDILITTKGVRVALLGTAGQGKTTELKQTALQLIRRKTYPLFISLANYSPEKQTINQYLNVGWRALPPDKTVLFMDGFDEIQPANIIHAIRNIQAFAEQNPQVRIVLSSRTNFYEQPQLGYGDGTLQGFTIFYLQHLTETDCKRYISEKYKFDYNDFINEVDRHNLNPLLENPFFLNAIAGIYATGRKLDGNRGQIIYTLIKEQLYTDIAHYRNIGNAEELEKYMMDKLRYVALSMVMTGMRTISQQELKRIIPDKQNRNLIKCSTIFYRSGNSQVWEFQHAYFLEYLAAEYLSTLTFSHIQKLVTGESTGRVMPAWQNTVMLLLSTSDSDILLFGELVNWLIDTDPEILLWIETERLSSGLREHIFYDIFKYHKVKKTNIHMRKDNLKDYARFGNTTACIDFIFSEAVNTRNENIVRINALEVLSCMDFSNYIDTRKVLEELIRMIDDPCTDEYLTELILDCIIEADIYISRDIDYLLQKFQHNDNEFIRRCFYRLFIKENTPEQHIDYLIEGLYLDGTDHDTDDEIYQDAYSIQALIRCKSGESISRIIQLLIQNKDYINISDATRFFVDLVNNAIQAYPTHNVLFEDITDLLTNITLYNTEQTKNIIRFFYTTGTFECLIDKLIYKNIDILPHKLMLLAYIIDLNNYQQIIRLYNQHSITEEDIQKLCLDIPNDKEKRLICKEITKQTGIKIVIQRTYDWRKYNITQTQKAFDILFDQQRFKQTCYQFIDKYKPLTRKKLNCILIQRESKQIGKDITNRAVLQFIENITRDNLDQIITQEFIDQYIYERNMVYFIYNMLCENGPYIIISRQHITYLQIWFDKHILNTDFTTAVGICNRCETIMDGYATILFLLMKVFNFKCPESKLYEMTLCAVPEFIGYPSLDYLYERCTNKKEFNSHVVENIIDNKISFNYIYQEHVTHIFSNKLSQAYRHIINELTCKQFDNDTHNEIIKLYFRTGLPSEPILEMWDQLDIHLKLTIAEELFKKEEYFFLLEKLPTLYPHAEKEDQKTILNLLIECGDIQGLAYGVTWTSIYKEDPFDMIFELFDRCHDIKLLPAFLEILRILYTEPDITDREQFYLNTIAGIRELALADKENFPVVINALKMFVASHKSDLLELNRLEREIDDLKEQYDKKYYPIKTLTDAGELLDTF